MLDSTVVRINELAQANLGRLAPRTRHLNEKSASLWAAKAQVLQREFQELTETDECERWLRDFFLELNSLLSHFEIEDVSRLIDSLAGMENRQNMVCKMFVATLLVAPKSNDEILHSLVKMTACLHDEVVKFSKMSTQIMTKEQSSLLRHLLKKQKYELKKFNLLSECANGYSQVIMLLFNLFHDFDSYLKLTYYVDELQHIMGKYSLDSMRCLDIILNTGSDYITDHYELFLSFLKKTDYWPTNDAADYTDYSSLNLGGNMVASTVVASRMNNVDTSENYYDLCCLLIRSGFVNFMSIWHNIEPSDTRLEEYLTKYKEDQLKDSLKGIENPLAMADALTAGDDDDTITSTDKEAKAITDEQVSATESKSLQLESIVKRKHKFLQRLLAHGCLEPVVYILKKLPSLAYLDGNIAKLFGRLIDKMIDPLYSNIQNMSIKKSVNPFHTIEDGLVTQRKRLFHQVRTHDPFVKIQLQTIYEFYYSDWNLQLEGIHSLEELFKISHKYFPLLGPYLAYCPALLSKICRIAIHSISQGFKIYENDAVDAWTDYARKFLIQSISCPDISPSIARELYQLLQKFPFEKRYFLYNEMLTKISKDVLMIQVGFNKAEREVKGTLKALSTDTIDRESRRLANQISANPLATLPYTVKQIENYDKVSELVVTTTKYFNDFAFDVLQYVLLVRLTERRSSMQEDGLNQMSWVLRLSFFIAGLANHSPMDLDNIIQYIIKTLHDKNMVAATILKELITTVGGIRDLNEVSVKSLIMLNSGEPIKQQARILVHDTRDENRTKARRLIQLFAKHNAISEVILLLYQLNLDANTKNLHYKILSAQCDNMSTLLWSFIELVNYCYKRQDFESHVLPFESLVNEYHLPPVWTFHTWRSYLEDHPQENNLSTEENLRKATFDGVDFKKVPKEMFLVFWKLSLYQVHFDKSIYDDRKQQLEKGIQNTNSNKRKNEISKQIQDVMVSCIQHQRVFNEAKQVLEEKSKSWIQSEFDMLIKEFIQHCLLPRMLFSPSDAIYCSDFIFEAFPLESIIDLGKVLFQSRFLSTVLFACTSSEAGAAGIFFQQFFDRVEQVRRDPDTKPEVKRIFYEWNSLLLDDIISLLREKNYMSIRNGIEFMKQLSAVFPIIDTHIQLLKLTLELNLEGEEREDIVLPTNALIGHLRAGLRDALSLEKYCQLSPEEVSEKLQKQSELKEIESYESSLENERKQEELRKQLELNKQKRLSPNIQDDSKSSNKSSKIVLPTGPSALKISTAAVESSKSWPMGKLLKCMDDVVYYLNNNNLNKAAKCIENKLEATKILDSVKRSMPVRDFQNVVLNSFSVYFKSLIHYPQHPEFKRKLELLRNSTNRLTQESKQGHGNQEEASMRTSRYNTRDSTSAELRSKVVDIKGSRYNPSTNNSRRYNRGANDHPPSSQQSRLTFNSSTESTHRGLKHKPTSNMAERPTKKLKSDSNSQSSTRNRASSEKTRYGDRNNNQTLPPGPKGTSNPSSRYRK